MPGVVHVWWLYGQNLPYNFKKSYGDSHNRNFENGKIIQNFWSPVRSETGFVILGKFWSRNDLPQRRNRKFLGGDQGYLSERTIPKFRYQGVLTTTMIFA